MQEPTRVEELVRANEQAIRRQILDATYNILYNLLAESDIEENIGNVDHAVSYFKKIQP